MMPAPMRLYAVSEVGATGQAEAQALADKIHAHKIATDPHYALAVSNGWTKRWAIPTRDVDLQGNPVGKFYIPVEGDCLDCLTAKECETLDAAGKTFLAARSKA